MPRTFSAAPVQAREPRANAPRSRRIAALCAVALTAGAASAVAASPATAVVPAPVSPTFTKFQEAGSSAFTLVQAAADLNGDGNLDIVSDHYTTGFRVELGNGDGTLGPVAVNSFSNASYGAAVGDINNDGKQDVFVRGNSSISSVFWGVGNGTFIDGPDVSTTGSSYGTTLADFDNDGLLDLAVPTSSSVSMYRGNGAGAFTLIATLATGTTSPWSPRSADFNRDGYQDLMLPGWSSGVTSVLLSNGAGAFGFRANQAYTGSGSLHHGIGDLNGDGYPDIARADGTGVNKLVFTPGTGNFVASSVSANTGSLGSSAADFNGDGYVDIGTVQGGNEVFYLNDGAGSFTRGANVYPASSAHTQLSADLNNDGQSDVVVASNYGRTTVFTNTTGPSAPVVRSQPANQTVNNGATATFTAARGGNPGPAAQWQQLSTATGAVFTDITGATSTTYTVIGIPANDGYQYRVVFTNASGTATSNAATLSLNDYAPSVDTQTGNVTATAGDVAVLSVTAFGKPAPTYQWQVSVGGAAYMNISGETANTYQVATSYTDNGHSYQVVLTNSAGAATSTPSSVTVNRRTPSVTAQPADFTGVPGNTASFTASVDADPVATVQWQVSTDAGATYNDIAGATSGTVSFTMSATMHRHLYRAVFTNAFAESATSDPGLLSVGQPAVVTAHPADVTRATGNSITFTAAATGYDSVRWQVSTDNGTMYADIAGASSESYRISAVTAADNQNLYRAVFSSIAGSTSTTGARLNTIRAASAPLNFTAVQTGPRQLTVSWEAPADQGESPITGYTLGIGQGNFGNVYDYPAAQRSVVFDDFEIADHYTFGVSAASAFGNGAAASAALTKPTPVSAPPALVVAPVVYGKPSIALERATITHGEVTKLTGTTKPNTLVNIYGSTRRVTTFSKLATVRSDDTGGFLFTTTLAANTKLFVVVPRLGTSTVLTQNIRSTVTLTATKLTPNRYVFNGTVTPGSLGALVTIYYRTAKGGKAVLVKTNVDRNGNYRVSRTIGAFGHHNYTIFAHVDTSYVMLGNNTKQVGIATFRAR